MYAEDSTFQPNHNLWLPNELAMEEFQYDQSVEPLKLCIKIGHALVERARSAASWQAESYRGFNVGCSALAVDEAYQRYAIVTTGNFKAKLPEDEIDEHDVEDIPKFCAEMDAVHRAEESGYDRVVGLFVAATSDRQEIKAVNFVDTTTLHPCLPCRDVLRGSPAVRGNTLIVTVGHHENVYQAQTASELNSRYNHGNDSFVDAPSQPYSTLDWQHRSHVFTKLTKNSLPSVTNREAIDDPRYNALAMHVLRASIKDLN